MKYIFVFQNRMWTVVNFQSDNLVAAVPKFWYRNSMCAWPKKFNSKLITKRAKPNTLEFSYFKAKVLFKNIGMIIINYNTLLIIFNLPKLNFRYLFKSSSFSS